MKIQLIRIYCDGSGSGPHSQQSGFAWFREDTGEKHIEHVDALTNNDAEYRAVISALKALRKDSHVEVLTDSLLVVSQLRGEYRILNPRLAKLASEVKTIVEINRLTVRLRWIPRAENRAGNLL